MEAGFSPNAGMPAPTGGQDLIGTVSAISNSLMGEVSKVIIGKNENLRRVTVGILSNGNMLLEDFPGLAKTLLANTFARALGCKFKRVQFTPDLLPSDIMGTYMYVGWSNCFEGAENNTRVISFTRPLVVKVIYLGLRNTNAHRYLRSHGV